MRLSTKFDSIFKLFLHNIRTAGVDDRIVILKGSSDTVLPILPEGFFDFIYVDGDHAYPQVRKDTVACLKLLRKGGVICGDDLELQASSIGPVAPEKRDLDYIQDEKTKKWFHPGVTLVVGELLGPVAEKEGFWHKIIE